MTTRYKFSTKRLIIRNFNKNDDFHHYFEMIKKQSKNYLAINHTKTKKKDIFLKIKNYQGILFAIFLKNNKVNIGTIGVSAINEKYLSCNIGILIHNKFHKKGYAFEAMQKTIHYCHSKLNINEIYLWVKKNNLDAIKLYEKLGFLLSKSKKKHYLRVKLNKQKELFMLKKNDIS